MTVLADTGALYALMDRDDAWHARVRAWWLRSREDVLVPVMVLPEVAYLLGRRIGPEAELAFTRAIIDGEFVLEGLAPEDVERAAELMGIYVDTPLGLVDACVVAAAERLDIVNVLTVDRRHFSLVRPRHVPSLKLLP
ncbi:MAG TPA: PIN domain-containing protein [Gemmatimonadaceae bacterium]|nr:PIN domain-containing protein [Gemmatimonadaceae bacterium]